MLVAKPVGRDAAAKKYDILSALAAFALSQDKHKQRQVMRLMALITTRYNWQRDELSMGQAEIARLWSVDTRTVKREMSKLRALGWLVVKSQGARGRVSTYRLDLARMMSDTRPAWANVGPDFVARMGGQVEEAATNVVPFRGGAGEVFGDDTWGRTCAAFNQLDPAAYAAWIAPLTVGEVDCGQLVLVAPSKFHATYVTAHLLERLTYQLRHQDPTLHGAVIVAG